MNCKNWKKVKLGNIGNVIGGGTPSTKIPEYYEGDISWITPKDLSNFKGKYISRGERMISETGLKNSSARMLPEGTVLFTSRAPIGYIAIAKNKISTNQGFKSIVPNRSLCNNEFLFYLLKYHCEDIKNIATGTTFLEVSGSALKNFEVNIPALGEQEKIANVLGSLDNKIELNEKINQNLEAQAQAIFKSWFVDFEPFGGKMPKDWKVSQLRMLCETITKGTTPTTLKRAFVKKGINFFKAESISSNHTIDLKRIMFIDDETNAILKRSQIKPFDILYTIAGTIGRFAIVMPSQIPANTNQAVAIIRCKSIYTFFVYSIFLYEKNLQYFNSKIVQAVQANLSLGSIGDLPVILPSHDVLDRYSTFITPILDAIFKNNEESNRLAQLRDTLLPKLMSGEIDVSDVAV